MANSILVFPFLGKGLKLQLLLASVVGFFVLALSFPLAARISTSTIVVFIGVFVACVPMGLVYFVAHRARRRIEIEGGQLRAVGEPKSTNQSTA